MDNKILSFSEWSENWLESKVYDLHRKISSKIEKILNNEIKKIYEHYFNNLFLLLFNPSYCESSIYEDYLKLLPILMKHIGSEKMNNFLKKNYDNRKLSFEILKHFYEQNINDK